MPRHKHLDPAQFHSLSEFRYQIRRFLAFSEQAAKGRGIEPHQYQLLLAVQGCPPDHVPSIGYLAECLQIRHNSTVELVDRMTANGLVRRNTHAEDKRQVIVSVTPEGSAILHTLAGEHLKELLDTAPALVAALAEITRERTVTA